MTAPRFHGLDVDGPLALALLDWQREMGVDEAMLDAPVNRLEAPAAAPAAVPLTAAQPTPVPPLAGDEGTDAAVAAAALAAGAGDLAALAEALRSFEGLELRRGARGFCFADGVAGARVMIVGEVPGEDEDAQGTPFAGRAGHLLDRMLAAIGLSRTAPDPGRGVYLASPLPWRPPGSRPVGAAEMTVALPFLHRHIQLARPEALVLMGSTPCQALLGQGGIQRIRGTWTEALGIPVLPMTHPAYLLKTPAAKRDAWADLLSLAARLGL